MDMLAYAAFEAINSGHSLGEMFCLAAADLLSTIALVGVLSAARA